MKITPSYLHALDVHGFDPVLKADRLIVSDFRAEDGDQWTERISFPLDENINRAICEHLRAYRLRF